MSGPAHAVAAIRRAIATAIDDVSADGLVLVGCSGGADSLALAAGLAYVGSAGGRPRVRTGAVIVDHGLQPGSGDVARRAAQQCRSGLGPGQGMDLVEVVAVTVTAGAGGMEARARTARYGALSAAAMRHGAACVLLGHTMDDQAETVLLRLARGSGAASLAGMPAVRGVFRRPLLGLRRADTEAACRAQGIDPWHDPTNTPADDRGAPRRSVLRVRVLPTLVDALGPGVVPALARSATLARADAEVLDALAEAAYRECAASADGSGGALENEIQLDVPTLVALPDALRWRVLRRAVLAVGGPPGSVGYSHVLAADALVTGYHGQGPLALPGSVTVRRTRHTISVLGSVPQPSRGAVGDRRSEGA